MYFKIIILKKNVTSFSNFFLVLLTLNCLETGLLKTRILCFLRSEYMLYNVTAKLYIKAHTNNFSFQTQKNKIFYSEIPRILQISQKVTAIVPKNDNYIIPTM